MIFGRKSTVRPRNWNGGFSWKIPNWNHEPWNPGWLLGDPYFMVYLAGGLIQPNWKICSPKRANLPQGSGEETKTYFKPPPSYSWTLSMFNRFSMFCHAIVFGCVYRLTDHPRNWHQTWKLSKKSPTGPTERTPKPEYLTIGLATYLGVRW